MGFSEKNATPRSNHCKYVLNANDDEGFNRSVALLNANLKIKQKKSHFAGFYSTCTSLCMGIKVKGLKRASHILQTNQIFNV
jgi:hypothetical protein